MGPISIRGLVKIKISHQIQIFRAHPDSTFFLQFPYSALPHGFSRFDFSPEPIPLPHTHAPALPSQEDPVLSIQQIDQ